MVRFNGTDYFYVYNLRGDVVAMIDANGTQVVEYYYDAWGAPISKTDTMTATLGTVNPFRYRGYVYDEETGLYYLRSRYYNPVWKRFINADIIISAMGRLLTCNPFVYCWSNPTGFVDSDGSWGKAFKSTTVYGVTVSGTVGMYTATYSKGLAYDTEKNVAVYESFSGLPIAGSDETVLAFDVGVASSLSVFYQVIPGKTVNEIEHAGSFIGASAGPISIDAIMLRRMVNKDSETHKTIPTEKIDGLQVAFGASTGLDLAHFGDSFTTLTYILRKGKIVDKNARKNDENYRPSLIEFLLNDVFKIR